MNGTKGAASEQLSRAEQLLASGNYRDALGIVQTLSVSEGLTLDDQYALQWPSLDPLHEPAHRLLMELYADSGQRAAALRQYAECECILKQELELGPQPETTELYESIRLRRSQVSQPAHSRGKAGSEEPIE
jgi:hypothetical protein